MREITDHKVSPVNDTLTITTADDPGADGANHAYRIMGYDSLTNPSADNYPALDKCSIVFQNGPISVAGVNGITQEALLAIVADRLRSFQAGPYACIENAQALGYVEAAMNVLKSRTLARMARGVEGTHTV